jgi:hypothetical protein
MGKQKAQQNTSETVTHYKGYAKVQDVIFHDYQPVFFQGQ